MTKKNILPLLSFFLLLISSCTSFQPGYETPVVTISSFEAIPGRGMIPRFQIGLHIVNPNRSELDLKGIAYTISLEGHKLITGVSNQLPKIAAYGEGDVMLNASVDLFNSVVFLKDLMSSQRLDQMNYTLKAKLDAGTLYPLIQVTRKGKLSFNKPL